MTSPIPSALALDDANFHSGQRLADGVRAKGPQIIHRDRSARFREAVAVGNGDAEIVEKLKRLRLGESAADDDSAKLAAERLVDLFQQAAAKAEARAALGERFVDGNNRVKHFAFA